MYRSLIYKKKISRFINQKKFVKFFNQFEKSFNIPKSVLVFETKQLVARNFNFDSGKFPIILKLSHTFFSSVKYFFFIIIVFLFSKKKKIYEVSIVFDDVDNNEMAARLIYLAKKFSSYCYIGKSKLSEKYEYFNFNNYKNINSKTLNIHLLKKIIFIFLISFYFSYRFRINFVHIAFHLMKQTIKYKSIFSHIKAKYLFHERYYYTSAIKNFIFKENGGLITTCIQKNIHHLGRTGFFIDVDFFLSLGNKSFNKFYINITDSNVKKIIPVGSYYLEEKWLRSKKIETKLFDIVFLAGNNLIAFGTHKSYINDYIQSLMWLAQISNEMPFLKIAIKHHHNNNDFLVDKFEKKIMKNTSISRVFSDNKNNLNYSYNVAFASKLNLTWCSTMAYELLGHNKPCFFLDPGYRNFSFLGNLNFNKKWRISNYNSLRSIIKNVFVDKKIIKIKNPDSFCLNSKKVSDSIFRNLNIH